VRQYKKGDKIKLLPVKNKEEWPFELEPSTTAIVYDWVDHLVAYWVVDDKGNAWYAALEAMELINEKVDT
jgi:hypothetical protein